MNIIPRRRQAMTLIEMLAVIALSAAIVGVATWILNTAKTIWLEEQLRVGAVRTAALWEHQFCKELRAALPPGSLEAEWVGRDGSVSLLDSYPAQRFTEAARKDLAGKRLNDDSIRFATAQIRDTMGRIRPGVVEYRVVRNAETGTYGVTRKAAAELAALDGAHEVLVARSVVSLDLQYLDEDGAWVSGWSRGDKMPRAVRITAGALSARTGMDPEPTYLTTEVHLPTGERIKQ